MALLVTMSPLTLSAAAPSETSPVDPVGSGGRLGGSPVAPVCVPVAPVDPVVPVSPNADEGSTTDGGSSSLHADASATGASSAAITTARLRDPHLPGARTYHGRCRHSPLLASRRARP